MLCSINPSRPRPGRRGACQEPGTGAATFRGTCQRMPPQPKSKWHLIQGWFKMPHGRLGLSPRGVPRQAQVAGIPGGARGATPKQGRGNRWARGGPRDGWGWGPTAGQVLALAPSDQKLSEWRGVMRRCPRWPRKAPRLRGAAASLALSLVAGEGGGPQGSGGWAGRLRPASGRRGSVFGYR